MKLSFERQFLIGGHTLGAIGVAALATTHQVGTAYVVAALAALAWSLVCEWRRGGWQVPTQAANASMLAALVAILIPVVFRGASPIRAIAEFLLVLAALKFAAAKETRDWVQIYVLSFFHLLAASALTVEPIFALVFLAYLVVAPCVLVLSQLRREVGEAGGSRRLAEETFVEPSLFRSLASMTVVLFVSTLVVFVALPAHGRRLLRRTVRRRGDAHRVLRGGRARFGRRAEARRRGGPACNGRSAGSLHGADLLARRRSRSFSTAVTGGGSHRRFGRSFGALPASSRRRPPRGVDRSSTRR